MNLQAFSAVLFSVGLVALPAGAQTVPPPAGKLALAREMLVAAGGSEQMNKIVTSLFGQISASVDRAADPQIKRIETVLLTRMQAHMLALMPKILEVTVNVYAANLTEDEMKSYIAWAHSDAGRSLMIKMPVMTNQALQEMLPMIQQTTQAMKADIIDEACKEAQCSLQDRALITTALDKAMPKQPS